LNALCTSIPVHTRTTPSRSQARPPGGPAHSTSQSEANLPARGSNVPAGSQRSNCERIIVLRQQLEVAMAALRTTQAQNPAALTANTQALAAASEANVDYAADEENVIDEDRARVVEYNRLNFIRLLDERNLRRGELAAAEARAMDSLTDLLRIQAEITAAISHQPPAQNAPRAPRAPPAPTSHRSDKQDDKKDKEHRAMVDILLGLSKSNSNINPESIALLGQPQAPQAKPRPPPSGV
jgi:hypothetical protein